MRKDLLNLYVGKKLLKFVKNIRFLQHFSKNFSLYSSDLLNLYVLVSISKNVMFYAFGLVYFLLNFSRNLIFYQKFSKIYSKS